MKPMPEGPNRDDPVRYGGERLWTCAEVVEQIEKLPTGIYEGAHHYDTDDETVIHLWRLGESWDIRLPRVVR